MERLSRTPGAYTQEIREKVQIRLLKGFVGMGTQAPYTDATVAAIVLVDTHCHNDSGAVIALRKLLEINLEE